MQKYGGNVSKKAIGLSAEAREALEGLREEVEPGTTQVPRLTEKRVTALVMDEPGPDDVVIEDDDGPLLAVSPDVAERLAGRQLQVRAENGEIAFTVARQNQETTNT